MIISLLKVHQTFFQEITLKPLRNEEYRKIRKPDRFPGKNIIISFQRSKPNNLLKSEDLRRILMKMKKKVDL